MLALGLAPGLTATAPWSGFVTVMAGGPSAVAFSAFFCFFFFFFALALVCCSSELSLGLRTRLAGAEELAARTASLRNPTVVSKPRQNG